MFETPSEPFSLYEVKLDLASPGAGPLFNRFSQNFPNKNSRGFLLFQGKARFHELQNVTSSQEWRWYVQLSNFWAEAQSFYEMTVVAV